MTPQVKNLFSIIGTAGHVDHGKSTLVKALTGIETDRLAEEKRRGVSIELGFAYMDFKFSASETGIGVNTAAEHTGLLRAAIVDVPGHEQFLNTMLRGATGFGVTLLVVAADDGIMPQTVEHLDILHLLGVKDGVVVLSKTDLVSVERITEVEADVRELLKDTLLEGAPVVRYSSVGGTGLDEIRRLLSTSLLKRMTDAEKGRERRVEEEFFRLPIDRSFPIKGFGTVVTGSVASGTVTQEQGVELFPEGKRLKVRGVESLGRGVKSVSCGERAALNLSGIKFKELSRGSVLTSSGLAPFTFFVSRKDRLRVDLCVKLLGNLPGLRSIVKVKNNSLLKLHHLTGSSLVRIRFSDRKELLPGDSAPARLLFTTPLLLLRGDVGILRDPATNSTIGGIRVALPYINKRLMPDISSIIPPPLKRCSVGSKEDILMVLDALLPSGGLGFEVTGLSVMLNIKESFLVKRLEGSGTGKTAFSEFSLSNGYVVCTLAALKVRTVIKERLKDFHLKILSAEGLSEELLLKSLLPEFSRGLGFKRAKVVLKGIIDSMIKGKEIIRAGAGTLMLAERKSISVSVDAEVENAILKELNANGLKVKQKQELKALPFSTKRVDAAVEFLKKSGSLVEVKRGAYLGASTMKSAEEKLRQFLSLNPSIEAKEFRDQLGCGRKLAIEILEYFDRIKVTLRRGDERILR